VIAYQAVVFAANLIIDLGEGSILGTQRGTPFFVPSTKDRLGLNVNARPLSDDF
jgi:hypothetical protein